MQLPVPFSALMTLAGAGQLALALASVTIPRTLRWREDTARLRPLTRQVFWTYAGYIWVTNIAMGLLSVCAPGRLAARDPLAAAVSGYIAAYWLARLVIQFTYFDRSAAPPGAVYKLAEAALVALFLYLAVVYTLSLLLALGVLR